jgi:hypothetical protein
MNDNRPEAHDATPADQPLALKFSEELGPLVEQDALLCSDSERDELHAYIQRQAEEIQRLQSLQAEQGEELDELREACAGYRAAVAAERERQRAECLRALRPVECSHTGMSYGDDKGGGPSNYTRGWGDCLKAVKAALGFVA